jgi:CheY-like chemotaxis protein
MEKPRPQAFYTSSLNHANACSDLPSNRRARIFFALSNNHRSAEAVDLARTPPIVIVVDRDKYTCKLLTHFLGELGCVVFCAHDSTSALQFIREKRPAVVITEVLLPGQDGLALCQQIKTDPTSENTDVIVFSAVYSPLRARHAGASAFLSKPLEPARMMEIISRLTKTTNRSVTPL